MTTALGIIHAAFNELQIYSPEEYVRDVDNARALGVLNRMIDSWSNESLTCFANLEQSFTMVPGVFQYTFGPGGTGGSVRPLTVNTGPGAAYVQDTNGQNYPVEMIDQNSYNLIGLRTDSSNTPDRCFYDAQFPLGIINLFPTPNIGWTFFFDSRLQVTEFASLVSVLALPLGYQLAMETNLAVQLAPFYAAAKLSPVTIKIAAESKGVIKRTNMRKNIARFDPEIISRAKGSYNIYSDRGG